MTEKEPIEIGRTRRPMECELTEAERKIRSDQVHSHLEIRKLEAQAKATKELGKAKDEEITELDLKIKELSTAVRTGRATIEVEILELYDPTTGEMVEKRADTGLLMPLGRKPTVREWDEIKRLQQLDLDQVQDGKTVTAPPAEPSPLITEAGLEAIKDRAQALGRPLGAAEGLEVALRAQEKVPGAGLLDETLYAAAKALGEADRRDKAEPCVTGRVIADRLQLGQLKIDELVPGGGLAELLSAYTDGYGDEPAEPAPKRGRGRPRKEPG